MGFNQGNREVGATITHQGGRGFVPTPEWELFLLVAGSLFSGDIFYEGDEARRERLARLASQVISEDPRMVGSFAVFARQVLGLRSGPAALVAHLFWEGPKDVALAAAKGVWLRGDEHLETLAYTKVQGWKVRKALKKAIADRLNSMSPYALLKYRAEERLIPQRKAIIWAHPRPRDEAHSLIFEYIVRGRKASPRSKAFVTSVREERPTWERMISGQGSTPEAWRSVVPHLEGLALVRNLRNLEKHGLLEDPRVQGILLEKLRDEQRVARWQVPSYGWILALRHTNLPLRLREAVEKAAELSVAELPLYGETMVLVDLSGSMETPLSQHSEATYKLAASTLGAILYKATGGRIYGFDNREILVPLGPEAPLAKIVDYLENQGGGGTYLGRTLHKLLPTFGGKRVVVFTDEQVSDDAYTPLKEWLRRGPDRRAHVINVAGYAPLAFPEEGLNRIGGFSDAILPLLPVMEEAHPLRYIYRRYGI